MGIPKDYNYQPLPDYLELKNSGIHGNGIFATKELKKYSKSDRETHYIIGDTLIRTALGGWINHSDDENCTLLKEDRGLYQIYYLLFTRDIKPGEEITLNYNNEMCGCGEDKLK